MSDFASSLGVDPAPPRSSEAEKQNFDLVRQQVKSIMREGYSAAQILSQVRSTLGMCAMVNLLRQLHDLIIQHPVLTARQKSTCALAFADADHALCDGADEELWVLQVALRVSKTIS
jgi:replication factor C subunit 2/4